MTWFPAGGCSGWGGDHGGPCACSVPAGPGKRALPTLAFQDVKSPEGGPAEKDGNSNISCPVFFVFCIPMGQQKVNSQNSRLYSNPDSLIY